MVYLSAKNCINKFKDERFVHKVLHKSEQQLLNERRSKHELLWFFWAVKEASYKCVKRIDPHFKFAPTKIVTEELSHPFFQKDIPLFNLEDCWRKKGFCDTKMLGSRVQTPNYRLFAKTLFTKNLVYTTVCTEETDFDEVYWGIKKISTSDRNTQSSEVRRHITPQIAALKGVTATNAIHIKKNEVACPEVFINGQLHSNPISLTHDDKYVAYSFQNDRSEPVFRGGF